MRKWINLIESNTPEVIQRCARGDWPKTLSGIELEQVLVLIDKGMESAKWFDVAWEEAALDGETLDDDHGHVAHLEVLEITKLDQPERGVADPELVDEYEKSHAQEFPPVIVWGNELRDGNHRVEAAERRGETHILAYVVQ